MSVKSFISAPKYLIDDLALYGFSKSPTSKLLLETAINNKKQRIEVLTKNEKIALKSGITNVKNLSNIQIIEKIKEKDNTNQEKLIESYASKDLNLAFNEIIEVKTGIGKEKIYSKAKAAVVGATPVNRIFGLPHLSSPAALDSKKVLLCGEPPGNV